MVGLFSRAGAGKKVPQQDLVAEAATGSDMEAPCPQSQNGVDPVEEFVPVEHPLEPPDNDRPVRCPPPEPCIIHDGRIWKERIAANARRRAEGPGSKDNAGGSSFYQRRHTPFSEHLVLPSQSAPEKALLKMFDDGKSLQS
ncbi:hypothetical protein O6H91_21G002800 [Diphasiastrum complanatum]|uniref:Uncharacterized protein n=1 Tax=Diphasiastrum complanatum TaxID=34168 RepID=A0ACC2AH60_DIPCM|nr:hypothetical protein O6H91_21G002800 [Diphasiastrum complanatum]